MSGTPPSDTDVVRAFAESATTAQPMNNGEASPQRGAEQQFDREVERLAELHPRRYERERADAAKQLEVRAAVLDKLVRAAQRKIEPASMGTEITFDEPTPSPQAVDGASLPEALTGSLHAHVKMSQAVGDATALWVVHTHAHVQARISPILGICSPEKRCGKSTLLAVLSAWVRRPLPASNISVSALFRTAETYAPTLLVDAADNWIPLLAIAELAGGEWPERARRAALELADSDLDEEISGVQLLRDIREVFEAQAVDRLHSADLLEALLALEERPWAEWRQGRPLTANGLAKLLRAFGIKACDVRIGATVKKGYRREKLEDAFSRYLPPLPNAITRHPNRDAGLGDTENATKDSDVAFRDAPKASNDGACSAVAFAVRSSPQSCVLSYAFRKPPALARLGLRTRASVRVFRV